MPDISLAQKSVLATVILGVAFLQLVFISAARGWVVKLPIKQRLRAVKAHHIGGYGGLLLILTIGYYCVFVYGSAGTTRSMIHALLGATAVTLVVGKVVVARGFRAYAGKLPTMGALLLGAIVGAWTSSAAWYFINF